MELRSDGSVHEEAAPATWSVEFEVKYPPKGMRALDDSAANEWMERFKASAAQGELKLQEKLKQKRWPAVLKRCRRNQIPPDFKVFGEVPLLNWFGQHVNENTEELIKCLVEAGLETDALAPHTDQLPQQVAAMAL